MPKNKSQSDIAIELISNHKGFGLTQDSGSGGIYVNLELNEITKAFNINDSEFKNLVSALFYKQEGSVLKADALRGVISTLAGDAVFGEYSVSKELSHRVYRDGSECIAYDLVNDQWQMALIIPGLWDVNNEAGYTFRRLPHQKEQVMPERGGNIESVLDYVNIQDDDQKKLFLVYLVSCFISGFPHPMPYFYGPQGSAKSTISKVIRALVDPSLLEVSQFPKNEEALIHALKDHYIIIFDNISFINPDQSDTLCKAITGSAFTKRKLYTDGEMVIFSFQKLIGANGINLVAIRPDLLERSLLFPLERIDEKDRKTESEVWDSFEKEKPKIMGAIFTILSQALEIYPSIILEEKPRMADFALWGCAIAEAIGFGKEDFMRIYQSNIDSQNMEVLYQDPTAILIIELMHGVSRWEGTASNLLNELYCLNDGSLKLPGQANALSRKLGQLHPNLKKAGIIFTKEDGKERKIILTQPSLKEGEVIENTEKNWGFN